MVLGEYQMKFVALLSTFQASEIIIWNISMTFKYGHRWGTEDEV